MKRNKIIFAIVFFMFVILVAYSAYIHSKQNEYIEIKQKQSFTILQQIIDGKIIFFRKLIAKRTLDKFHENEILKQYIISEDIKYNQEFTKLFTTLKRENKYIKSLHYISDKNICNFEVPYDYHVGRMELKRITTEVNKLKRAQYGFEVDDHALLYRLSLPIKYDNKHYGVLEIGVDPELFISDMTTIEKYLDSAIVVNKEKIKKYAEHDLDASIMISESGYVMFEDNPLFRKILDENLLNENIINYKDNSYKLFKYDLLDFDAEVEGMYLIASYVTDDKRWIDEISKLTVVLLFVLMILIFVAIYFGFDYYDKKIKSLMNQEQQNQRLLFQQSKMASMGEMIGNIAHQWRQPLSTITTAASGLKMQKEYGLLNDEILGSSVDMIMKQAEHMSKTIDDFRNFFRSDKEESTFRVWDVVQKDIELLDASLKNHSITIEVDIEKSLKITGHKNEFTQALLNIINNSKDQLNKTSPYNKIIRISANKDQKYLNLQIHDNGGGVALSIIDKVFEPYFTTKHQSQGTGIGLFMTSEIITKHFLGKIEVQNKDMSHDGKDYKGACFIISFPSILK